MLKDNQINIYSLYVIINAIFTFSYEFPDIKVIFLTTITIILISLQGMLKTDYENGIIEQIFLYKNIYLEVLKLIITHWIKNGFILSIMSILLISAHELEYQKLLIIFFSLMYTTLIITFIGSLGESATIHEKTNIKATIINFPFLIPTLVLNTLTTNSFSNIKLIIAFFIITFTTACLSTIITAINIKIAIKCK